MRASVIIPVRNNAAGLRLCLDALQRQTYRGSDFEIIVVDNDSTESLEPLQQTYPAVRWLKESAPSSYAARNRGLLNSQSEIVAFTDSDCQPTPTWLENGIKALEAKKGTIIGGEIAMLDPAGRALNSWELLEILASGLPDSRYLVEVRGFTPTGNLITYRSAFDRHGVFDASLKSAGDREWVTRAVRNGEKLVYAPDVVVMHPRRSTFKELVLKYRRQVGGRMMLLKRTNPSSLTILRELFLYSVFDPRIYIAGVLKFPEAGWRRVPLLGAILVMSICTTAERFRVCFGGSASRG